MLDLVFTCFYQQVNKVDYDADKDLWREIVGHILSDEQRGHEAYCSIFSIPNPLVRLFVEECHHQGAVERRLLDFVKLQMKLSFELKRGRHRANRSSQTIVCKRNSSTLSNGGVLIARNVIDHAIDQFHEDKLTLTEYTYTLFFLFLAANKTSGSALSSLIYFIAIRQDVQGKLRESIIADGVDSEYLELVINEAMRFLLPSRLGFPQTIASGSDSIQGTIPAYTLVLRSTFSFLRPTNLEKHQCDSVNGFKQLFKQRLYSNSYSTPHMTSAKNCSGKKFAMQGMKMLMNVLMRRYTFDFAPVDKNSMSSHASMIISQDSIQIRMYRITTEL